jgi:thiol-disulfide isomerase/thioredoxin
MGAVLAVALAATALAAPLGCGSDGPKSAVQPADYKRALAGAPPPLARLYAQPGRLLDGDPAAFRSQIAALRGHPVVVNKWASWCRPCRVEFPAFQKEVRRVGKRVAFLGVDAADSKGPASGFLKKLPVPYPSFFDPKSRVAAVFRGERVFPTTAFYDARGKLAYTKQGPYLSQGALAKDIATYAR